MNVAMTADDRELLHVSTSSPDHTVLYGQVAVDSTAQAQAIPLAGRPSTSTATPTCPTRQVDQQPRLHLAEAGRRDEGLAAAQEADDLRPELPSNEPDRFDVDLKASLSLLDQLTAEVLS